MMWVGVFSLLLLLLIPVKLLAEKWHEKSRVTEIDESDGAASIILDENGDHRPRLSGRFDCLCMGLQAQRLFRLLEVGVTINIVFLRAWETRRTLTSLGGYGALVNRYK